MDPVLSDFTEGGGGGREGNKHLCDNLNVTASLIHMSPAYKTLHWNRILNVYVSFSNYLFGSGEDGEGRIKEEKL